MVLMQNVQLPQVLMRRYWRPEKLFSGYLVAALFCLPLVHAASHSVIWERGDQIVQLAPQGDQSAPPNDHPYSVTPEEISATLETLHLKYVDVDGDSGPVSVFTQEEIENLASAVATGLGRAAPSQDIIFHVIGARRLSPGAFAKRNRVSAGRLFYRDGKINIIFGQAQTPHRKKNIYGQTEQDFYPRNYGSRADATKHAVVFLTDSATDLYQDSTGARDDWIVIEPGGAIASAAATSQPEAEPAPAPPPASAAAPVVLAEAPTGAPSPAVSSSVDKEQAAATKSEATELTGDVEERLEKLKRLRDRELISEEAYQAKMKEILQEL